jgi:hypothetical protein
VATGRFVVVTKAAVLASAFRPLCNSVAVMATSGEASYGGLRAQSFELLETMAYLPSSGVRNEAAHLARLSASAAQLFGLALDGDDSRAVLHRSLATTRRPQRVRLTLSSTGEATIELGPMPAEAGRPVRLVVDTEPVSSSSVWLAHKTTQREVYDTRLARHPDADDVILVNEHGQLTESTIANLAVRLRGDVVHPAGDIWLPAGGGAGSAGQCRPPDRADAHRRGSSRQRRAGSGQLAAWLARRDAVPREQLADS